MHSISRQAIIRTYQFYAPIYDQLFGAILEPGRRALAKAAGIQRPATILEVGVGTGLTLAGYPSSSHITGIDLSPEMLARARLRAARLQEYRIDLAAMDAEHLQFADESFDCVTVPYVLSVTPDPKRLVSELRRVCKRGGTIVIVNHFSGSRFWWLLERVVRAVADRVGFRSDFDLEEQVMGHDWKVESVTDVNLFGLSKLVVIRNE